MTPPETVATRPKESLPPTSPPPRRTNPERPDSVSDGGWSKYLSIFAVSLKERMTYRGRFFARHGSPVPADGDDDFALASDL